MHKNKHENATRQQYGKCYGINSGSPKNTKNYETK